MDNAPQPSAPLDPTGVPTIESRIASALKLLIDKSRVRVGLMARRARNTLHRMREGEPEPAGPVHYHGVKKWARYHRRDSRARV